MEYIVLDERSLHARGEQLHTLQRDVVREGGAAVHHCRPDVTCQMHGGGSTLDDKGWRQGHQ